MSHASRVAELEQERLELRQAIDAAAARIQGIDAEISYLRTGTAPRSGLASLQRTEAIVLVLRMQGPIMSPSEILEALVEGGRNEQLASVTSTLSHLKKTGVLVLVRRGQYQLA